ncbi:zinc transporter ZntB, partial [Erwinia amylovora]|nr:zinc transporter ZntB [Erwinia amylovora]
MHKQHLQRRRHRLECRAIYDKGETNVDDIAGKSLQVSDAIISCQLDGKGGMTPINDGEVF